MMDVVGEARRGLAGLVGAALLGVVFAGTAVLSAIAPDDGRHTGETTFPKAFYAIRRVGAQIVEVDSNTGRVLRAVVDLGAPRWCRTPVG